MNEEIMKQAGFGKEVNKVKQGICPFCSKIVKVEDLKDVLSRKEFLISGLCKKCQDETFK